MYFSADIRLTVLLLLPLNIRSQNIRLPYRKTTAFIICLYMWQGEKNPSFQICLCSFTFLLFFLSFSFSSLVPNTWCETYHHALSHNIINNSVIYHRFYTLLHYSLNMTVEHIYTALLLLHHWFYQEEKDAQNLIVYVGCKEFSEFHHSCLGSWFTVSNTNYYVKVLTGGFFFIRDRPAVYNSFKQSQV